MDESMLAVKNAATERNDESCAIKIALSQRGDAIFSAIMNKCRFPTVFVHTAQLETGPATRTEQPKASKNTSI